MLLLVAGWAFAEGVLFVLVADISVSFVALRHGWRAGVVAAIVAAFAATAGGAVTYAWAAADPAGAQAAMLALPAIDAALIADTRAAFAADGAGAMLRGSLSGVPYKLYALAAGGSGAALVPFLLVSPLVRLPRFLFAALGTAVLSGLLSRWLGVRTRLLVLTAFWVVFYAWYFSVMPG